MLQTLVPPGFPAVQRHPLKIVALGDSLIYGFGDPLGGGWVERLRRQWMMESETTGHVLYNLGIRGNRVAQVSDRLENEFRQRGELRHNNPDAILLSVVAIVGWVKRQRNPTSHKVGVGFSYLNYTYKL